MSDSNSDQKNEKITYGIQVIEDYHVIKVNDNISLIEAKKKYPDRIELLKKGHMLHQQKTEFTLSEVLDLKNNGFHYQFGFATAYDKIPYKYLAFVKITQYDI